jgi:hypothetical protein
VGYVLSKNVGRFDRPFAVTQNKAWGVTVELTMTALLAYLSILTIQNGHPNHHRVTYPVGAVI